MIPHWLLIDVSPWMYRQAWRAHQLANLTDDQRVSNAVAGCRYAVERLIASVPRVTDVRWCFDAGDSGRTAVFPAYKAGRSNELWETVQGMGPGMVEIAGSAALRVEGYEADDVMATVVRERVAAGEYCTVVAADKDLLQLVRPRVRVGCPELKRPWHTTDADVLVTLGVRADQVVDYLALVGDASDGLPGVAGVGPKTAAKLLSRASLDAMLADPDPQPIVRKIQQCSDTVLLMRRLATLIDTVPLGGGDGSDG